MAVHQQAAAFSFRWADAARAALPFLALVLGVVATRVLWLGYTNFTYEDAFITFRYAQQLANGHGWAHNTGELIYGTTTPLLTLLLAAWLLISPGDVVLGARVIGMAAACGTLLLLWRILARLQVMGARRLAVVVVLVVAEKLIVRDAGGMETPLVIFFMVAAWYALLRERPIWAGIAAGLLLWTRIDTVPWIAALAAAAWWAQRRPPWRFVLAASLTYTPWLLFATATFGSPLPYTLIAKQDAYSDASRGVPLWQLLSTVLQRRIVPFTLLDLPRGWGVWVAMIGAYLLALWGAWRVRGQRWLLVLPLFLVVDVAARVLTRSTFDNRYTHHGSVLDEGGGKRILASA